MGGLIEPNQIPQGITFFNLADTGISFRNRKIGHTVFKNLSKACAPSVLNMKEA